MRVATVLELLTTYRDDEDVATAIFGKVKGQITAAEVRAALHRVPGDHSIVLYDLPGGRLAIETRKLLQE